jgi:hypothetical protein
MLLTLAGCPSEPTVSRETPKPGPTAPLPVLVGGSDGQIKHGSVEGPGTGGGKKDAAGDKTGAWGFKHGSGKGDGSGGGKKDGSGDDDKKPIAPATK